MTLPPDIHEKIKKMYSPSDQAEVESFLISLWSIPLNVGPAQLARAILCLSAGDMLEIRRIKESGFYGDPRDLIVRASAKADNTGESKYFTEPFQPE
ncbi:MAG: hypothetical protein EOO45_03950 [Flavobacterium sp.]|nr:MAG: hypothetical protein EOO45_03950 [Flavobacterium sp.]